MDNSSVNLAAADLGKSLSAWLRNNLHMVIIFPKHCSKISNLLQPNSQILNKASY